MKSLQTRRLWVHIKVINVRSRLLGEILGNDDVSGLLILDPADVGEQNHYRHNKHLDASLAARPHVNGAAILVRATLHNSHIGTDENIPDSSAAWGIYRPSHINKNRSRGIIFHR